MRTLLVLATLLTLAPVAGAQVLRCTDAAGKMTYTNTACPAGTRPVGQVDVPAAAPQPRGSDATERPAARNEARRDDVARTPADAVPRTAVPPSSPPPPSGPVIIDSRSAGNAAQPPNESGMRNDGALIVDDGYGAPYPYPYPYPYAGYPGTARAPRALPDMRPRIRQCDGAGCQDTQGNHYGTSGQIDRYRSIDGKTCRPIGTTTVCR